MAKPKDADKRLGAILKGAFAGAPTQLKAIPKKRGVAAPKEARKKS
jgi:hypothetical protein